LRGLTYQTDLIFEFRFSWLIYGYKIIKHTKYIMY